MFVLESENIACNSEFDNNVRLWFQTLTVLYYQSFIRCISVHLIRNFVKCVHLKNW